MQAVSEVIKEEQDKLIILNIHFTFFSDYTIYEIKHPNFACFILGDITQLTSLPRGLTGEDNLDSARGWAIRSRITINWVTSIIHLCDIG